MMKRKNMRLPSWSLPALVVVTCGSLVGCATMSPEADPEAPPSITTAAGALQAGDEAARRGDFQTALAHYVRAVGIEASVDGWLRVGAVYTRLDQKPRALAAYLKVLELDPNQIDARENVGLEYLALGDHEAAREHLSYVLDADPQRWRARNGLGVAADRAGDHAVAIEHYLAALGVAPDSPMILNNLGYSRYLAGDFE